MAGKPVVTLHKQFSQQLNSLMAAFQFWKRDGIAKLEKAHRIIGQRVKGEATRRVPVESGRLKQGIITVTSRDAQGFVTEVGTNVKSDRGFPYPVVLEFGSRFIASGRVQALGDSANITDANAIKDWPAKAAGVRKKNSRGKFIKGGTGGNRSSAEQMPWLRPAWWFVMPEAITLINKALEPPSQGTT